MNEIHYDINQFRWVKDENTFYAVGWNLVGILPDGSLHPESFPSGKSQFIIKNYKTFGFRRFTFVDEWTDHWAEQTDDNIIEYHITNWIFESEDGIKCSICITP